MESIINLNYKIAISSFSQDFKNVEINFGTNEMNKLINILSNILREYDLYKGKINLTLLNFNNLIEIKFIENDLYILNPLINEKKNIIFELSFKGLDYLIFILNICLSGNEHFDLIFNDTQQKNINLDYYTIDYLTFSCYE